MYYNKIKSMLEEITEPSFFLSYNIKYISEAFGGLDCKSKDGETILHILADKIYDEKKSFLAIKSLLQYGFNPNAVDKNNCNFIQAALKNNCSEEYILKLINESLKYNLDVNHVNNLNENIMHVAIYNKYNKNQLLNIFDLLIRNGFDISKVDCRGRSIYNAALIEKVFTEDEVKKVKDKVIEVSTLKKGNNKMENSKENKSINNVSKVGGNILEESKMGIELTSGQVKELEKYGRILNFCEYKVPPTIAREKELRNLIITLAQEIENPMLVGDSGVGKTALVHELVYRIQRGDVPKFLKDRIVFEINPSQVVSGCKYVGEFEQNMNKLLELCKKYNIIAFIDEIHNIYGLGSSDGKKYDMAEMLKYYIDRSTFKVIGATTIKEYQENFKNDALKRRFEKIIIKEPEDSILKQIISKALDDYCIKKQIMFENENIKDKVIAVLLDITQKRNRVFDDMLNNPALAISIIDKAFGIACAFDCDFITLEHFIESIDFNYRIYGAAKQTVKNKLNANNSLESNKPKILQFTPLKNKQV